MIRRMSIVATVLSLLLCLATAAIAVRSYWRIDVIRTATAANGDSHTIVSEQGRIRWVRSTCPLMTVVHANGTETPNQIVPPPTNWESGGGGAYAVESHRLFPGLTRRDTLTPASSTWAAPGRRWIGREIEMSYLLPMTLFVIVPARWAWRALRRRRRRSRERHGLCARCGYDLRASRDRCPECGAAIQSALKPNRGDGSILAAARLARPGGKSEKRRAPGNST